MEEEEELAACPVTSVLIQIPKLIRKWWTACERWGQSPSGYAKTTCRCRRHIAIFITLGLNLSSSAFTSVPASSSLSLFSFFSLIGRFCISPFFKLFDGREVQILWPLTAPGRCHCSCCFGQMNGLEKLCSSGANSMWRKSLVAECKVQTKSCNVDYTHANYTRSQITM